MQKKKFSLAVGALLLSAGAVSAATVTDNLNLRSGPGLSHDVIGAIPAGSDVRVLNCSRSWCRVAFNDTTGFASRRFIVRLCPDPKFLLGSKPGGWLRRLGRLGRLGIRPLLLVSLTRTFKPRRRRA
jgi:Bacterial SH3 domain